MLRLNLVLAMIIVVCSLSAVTAQHRARKLFQAIESEQERSKALDVEYTQMQIEQSTWAVPTRIERVAIDRLRMHRPAPSATLRVGEDGLTPLAPPRTKGP